MSEREQEPHEDAGREGVARMAKWFWSLRRHRWGLWTIHKRDNEGLARAFTGEVSWVQRRRCEDCGLIQEVSLDPQYQDVACWASRGDQEQGE
jgi:hypothetical protein